MAVRRRLMAMAVVLGAVLSAGCWRAPVPMRSLTYSGPPEAKCLVVFLPGAGDEAEAFEQQGFVETMRKSGLSVDVISANATMGYYFKGVMHDRLLTDVITPARAAHPYQQLWVMGMSMGGMGSLFYSSFDDTHVDGVLAMAPYLGRTSLHEEIRDQGGLLKWKAPAKAVSDGDNYQDQLWRWLQAVESGAEPGPKIFMGWGTDDSLNFPNELAAAGLPKERVFKTKGGHDWPPWQWVLEQFLAEGTFASACAK